MSKRILYIISLVFIINTISICARAEKLIITKHDEFVDTKTDFFDVEGKKVYLDRYEGSAILLVFWATWCGGCVDEIASLDVLQKDFRKLPFKVIAVSEDYNGVEVVKKHFAENEIRYLEIFHDYQNKLFKTLSIAGLPTAYLINSEGKIKYIFNGIVKWHNDEVREMILAEIDGNPVLPKNTFTDASLNKQINKVKSIPLIPKDEENPPAKGGREEIKNEGQEVKNEENVSKKQ